VANEYIEVFANIRFDLLDATHLVNQNYKICMRRGNGYEVICYIPCTDITGIDDAIIGETVTSQVIKMVDNLNT